MDLSIIIPVYNTDPEILRTCFDSIRLLEEIAFEAIIVDDGSKADTGAFCKEYADQHENWRYIYQENGGVSKARNAGISHAGGRYIMFVDSDDILIATALTPACFVGAWDMVFFDYLLCREGHVRTCRLLDTVPANLCKKDFLFACYQNKTNAVWGKLFRKDFLLKAGIRFDTSMLMAEDAQFVLSAILEAETLHYVPVPFYCYAFSNDTGNGRLARFPWKVVHNLIYYYEYKTNILNEKNSDLQLTEEEAYQLHAAINAQLVKDLFEAVGSLAAMKMVFKDMVDMIAQRLMSVQESYGNSFSRITKIKCFLLRRKWMGAIRLCAYLRLLYLKLR